MMKRLFGQRAVTPDAAPDTAMAVLFDRGMRVEVVGEGSYQDALLRVCGRKTKDGARHECLAALVPDPSNPFDPDAVEVRIEGRLVGFLSRQAAQAYKPVHEALARRGRIGAAHATIIGGWDRGDGDEGSFGVLLDMNPFEWLKQDGDDR